MTMSDTLPEGTFVDGGSAFPNWRGEDCRAWNQRAAQQQAEYDRFEHGVEQHGRSNVVSTLFNENVGGNGNLAFATVRGAARRAQEVSR